MKKLVIACVLMCSLAMFGQTPTPTPTPAAPATLPSNVYAVGVSYNQGASPSIAGTGLYAHLISDGSGTYAFTVVDALPASVKPFTVNTNVGAGIAQKLFTVGKVPVLIPTAAGISFNGTNTGWSWSTGVLASIKVNGQLRIMPNVRVQKSSVSVGAGYQPIAGILIGWGQ